MSNENVASGAVEFLATTATLAAVSRVINVGTKKTPVLFKYTQPAQTVESVAAHFADGEAGLIRQAFGRVLTAWKLSLKDAKCQSQEQANILLDNISFAAPKETGKPAAFIATAESVGQDALDILAGLPDDIRAKMNIQLG